METTTLHHTVTLPASPQRVYDILTSDEETAAFTGAPANNVGSLTEPFMAYGNYCQGRNTELVPGQRIAQSWRPNTDEWPAGHQTQVQMDLRPHAEGTELTLTHSDMPTFMAQAMEGGWHEHYWNKLRQYLATGQPAETYVPNMAGATQTAQAA